MLSPSWAAFFFIIGPICPYTRTYVLYSFGLEDWICKRKNPHYSRRVFLPDKTLQLIPIISVVSAQIVFCFSIWAVFSTCSWMLMGAGVSIDLDFFTSSTMSNLTISKDIPRPHDLLSFSINYQVYYTPIISQIF